MKPRHLAQQIFSHYPNNYFIETGTNYGRGVYAALNAGFAHIHSIEIYPSLAQNAQRLFRDKKEVAIHEGDSKIILPEIIKDIDEPITFWLDAHYYRKSEEYKHSGPLKYELDTIRNHPRNDHTILIDDLNRIKDFGFTRKKIAKHLQSINKDYKIFRHMINDKETKILVAKI